MRIRIQHIVVLPPYSKNPFQPFSAHQFSRQGFGSPAGLAQVALVRGNPARAARLLGATEAVWDGPVTPARRRELDQAAAAVRAQLEAAEFEAAWTEGRAMPLDQAIALALQEVSAG